MIIEVKKVAPLTSAYNVPEPISDWYLKLQDLIRAINCNIGNINDLQGQSTENETNIGELQTQLSTLEENVTALTTRVETNEEDIDKLVTDTEKLSSDLSALTERVSTNETSIENINTRVDAINESITSINSDIATINSEIEALTNRVTTSEGNIETNTNAIASLNTWKEETDSKITDIEGKNTDQDAEIEELKSADVKIRSDIMALETDVSNLNDEVDTNKQSITALEDRSDGFDTEIVNLKTEQDTQNTEIESLKAKDVEHDTSIAALENNDKTQDNRLEALEDGQNEAASKITAIQESIATISSEQGTQNNDIITNAKAIENLTTQFQNLSTEFTTLEHETHEMVDNLRIAVTTNTNSIGALQNQMIQTTALYTELSGRVNSAEEKIEKLNTTVYPENEATVTEILQVKEGTKEPVYDTLEGTPEMVKVNEAITKNTSDISALQTNVESNSSKITETQSDVELNTNDITSLKTRMLTAESDIDDIQGTLYSSGQTDEDQVLIRPAFNSAGRSAPEGTVEPVWRNLSSEVEKDPIISNLKELGTSMAQEQLITKNPLTVGGKFIAKNLSDFEAFSELSGKVEANETSIAELDVIKDKMEESTTDGYVWTSTAANPSGEWKESTGGGTIETPIRKFIEVPALATPVELGFGQNEVAKLAVAELQANITVHENSSDGIDIQHDVMLKGNIISGFTYLGGGAGYEFSYLSAFDMQSDTEDIVLIPKVSPDETATNSASINFNKCILICDNSVNRIVLNSVTCTEGKSIKVVE